MELDISNNKVSTKKNIYIDLDGTVAEYQSGYAKTGYIGYPLQPICNYVKKWINQGHNVVIFTARVDPTKSQEEIDKTVLKIKNWCEKNLGKILQITAIKHRHIDFILDDKAISLVRNTGKQGISFTLDDI